MSIPSAWRRCGAALSKFLIKTHHCFLESLAEIINKLRISVFSTALFIHREGYGQEARLLVLSCRTSGKACCPDRDPVEGERPQTFSPGATVAQIQPQHSPLKPWARLKDAAARQPSAHQPYRSQGRSWSF